jgi:uncharacterized membrane protein
MPGAPRGSSAATDEFMKNLFLEHPRVWISTLVGAAVFFLLPGHWPILNRILVCWNSGAFLFLLLIYIWATRLTAEQICDQYIEEDASAPIILVGVTIAALLSLIAIVEPLATLKQVTGSARAAHFILATMTLISSWLLVPTMFTTHYADMFYSVSENDRPLKFPQTPMPVFWDFAYFSFTIAAACQTSDVETLGAGIRKVVIAHTLISFLFNASILGFAINVTAGLIGGA